jgi:leucyl-tRNA synthetase
MIPWDSKGIVGSKRFIERIYHLILESDFQKTQNKELAFLLNKTIKKVGEDIESMKFNTSISSLMILVNSFSENASALTKDDIKKFLIILSPFAPHLAEELWEAMGFRGLCAKQSWPEYDASLIKQDKVLVVVQVNGKFRDKIEVATGANQKEVEALVLASPKVKPWIDAKEFKKVIFVPDKLINIVV